MKLDWRSRLDPVFVDEEDGCGHSCSISCGEVRLAEATYLRAHVGVRRNYCGSGKLKAWDEEYRVGLSISHLENPKRALYGIELWYVDCDTRVLQPSKSDEAAIVVAQHYAERMANGADKLIDRSIADTEAAIKSCKWTESELASLQSRLEKNQLAKQLFLSFKESANGGI